MLTIVPLSPLREWASARSFISDDLAAHRTRHERARHERGRQREHFARGLHGAAATSRAVRVQRFDFVADPPRVVNRLRPCRDSNPHLVWIATDTGHALPVQGVDANEVAPDLVCPNSNPSQTLADDARRQPGAHDRAGARVGDPPFPYVSV